MADTSIILTEIEVKLRKLIGVKNQLADENKRLEAENEALKMKIWRSSRPTWSCKIN